MSKKDPKSLSELISSENTTIGQLAEKARRKVGLTDHVRKELAPEMGAGILHCDINDEGLLTVRASSPEWASRLRFENERLLTIARQYHPAAKHVRVRVAHPDRS